MEHQIQATIIDISPEALQQFENKLQQIKFENPSIRFGIKGGSCNGFSYNITYENAMITECDISWVIKNITFVVDKKSAKYLQNCRIVYRKSLIWSGFDFENPIEKSRCGCGESFSI